MIFFKLDFFKACHKMDSEFIFQVHGQPSYI